MGNVYTAFGKQVAELVESEFRAADGVTLVEVDEPANASYIKVVFRRGERRILFKIEPERSEDPDVIRENIRRHIEYSRRRRRTRE